MRMNIFRKMLVILIIAAPAVSYSGCKKQAKCGCGKDVILTLTNQLSYVYFNETGTVITFVPLVDPYSQYNFCNPSEMFPKLAEYKSGDQLLVSGLAYWNCTYLNQVSNSYYGSSGKVYDVQVTDVYLDPYGKK